MNIRDAYYGRSDVHARVIKLVGDVNDKGISLRIYVSIGCVLCF